MAAEKPGPVDPAWEMLRDEALEALDQLLQVATDTHEDLHVFSDAVARNRQHLAGDGRAADFALTIDIASTRGSLSAQLEKLERARGSARAALWKLRVAEGASIAEVAREWGLSRQLVSRAISSAQPAAASTDDKKS